MATEEELFRDQEINRLQKERVGISERLLDNIRGEGNVIEKSIKDLAENAAQRRNILDQTRKLNRLAQQGYDINISDLGTQRSLNNISKNRTKTQAIANSLYAEGLRLGLSNNKEQQQLGETLVQQVVAARDLVREFDNIQTLSISIGSSKTFEKLNKFSDFLKTFPLLKSFSGPFERAAEKIEEGAIASAKQAQIAITTGKGLSKEKLKEFGIDKKLQELAEGKVYWGTAAVKLLRNQEDLQKKIIFPQKVQLATVEAISSVTGKLVYGIFSVGFVQALSKINTLNTEFARTTGQTVENFEYLNTSLTTSVNVLEQAVSATKQFGVNADSLLGQDNLLGATELTRLLGLSAEDANNLALASDAFGRNVIKSRKEAFSQVGVLNQSLRSSVAGKIAIEDAAKASSGLTIALEGSLVALTSAAVQARAFGLSLQQVERIADGLLDIESSLTKEFEAQSILGIQTNLNRARGFALTDQMGKVVQELVANEELLLKFVEGNRIEREVVAGLIGLEVDELGKAILLQRGLTDLTDEQVKRAAKVNDEQFMQLTIQESITNSLEKLTAIAANSLEPVLRSIVNNIELMSFAMAAFAGIGLSRMIFQLRQAFVTLGLIKAVANPVQFGLFLTAVPLLTATLGAIAANRAKNVGDAIIPAGRGPIISTREGGLIQGTANDDIVMAPGIARGGRNAGLSQADVAAIAKAVRDGASQAQINLDGDRVSNRLQPSLAVNTRRYSI